MVAPARRSFLTRLTRNPYVAGATPTLGGLIFGCDISSMSAQWDNEVFLAKMGHPSPFRQGGITAAMPAGSFAGALLNSYLADKIGRKRCVILSGWIWVVGCIIMAVANDVRTLIAGRVIGGFAVGIASAIVTVYQAEITKPSMRGKIVSIQQLSTMSGIMIQYFVSFGFAQTAGELTFRAPFGLMAIPGALLGSLMFIFPESPRWLMDKDRNEEALQILADVHAAGDTEDALVRLEYNEIKKQIDFDRTQAARSYMDLFKPDVRLRVFLGMSDQMWSQLGGMNVMMMKAAGLQGRQAGLIASSVQYALGVAFTIPTVFLIDKLGRRPLMFGGAVSMASCLLIVGTLTAAFGHAVNGSGASNTVTWVVDGHPAVRNAIIVFSYLFVCSFASTWGPCSWTYASELTPLRVRAKAVSFATATNWTFNFVLGLTTPQAFHNLQFGVYYLYMAFNILAAIHVFFMFRETKGYSLEQIDEVFANGHPFKAWQVPKDIVPAKALQRDLEGRHVEDLQHDSRTDEKDEKGEFAHVENVMHPSSTTA
ncbi:hypothetical protein BMF94_4111 [Rhodotorula taiwanensis]|uniref:Major facilitator superfamily (MFS) profile domain-containing protein n=1 Tax=Rhodotorula taiwanensis TaxID=741276 RepID=A0A2S5B7W2_9BASI|nr:hypothetical protein BMF94_4111 [Rhodotorula taiwanensis]